MDPAVGLHETITHSHVFTSSLHLNPITQSCPTASVSTVASRSSYSTLTPPRCGKVSTNRIRDVARQASGSRKQLVDYYHLGTRVTFTTRNSSRSHRKTNTILHALLVLLLKFWICSQEQNNNVVLLLKKYSAANVFYVAPASQTKKNQNTCLFKLFHLHSAASPTRPPDTH